MLEDVGLTPLHVLLILDNYYLFGDIRNQSLKLYKIDRNFARFWLQIFSARVPRTFGTGIIKQIMWQSFTAIGRGSSGISSRSKQINKTSAVKQVRPELPPGTLPGVPGGLINKIN